MGAIPLESNPLNCGRWDFLPPDLPSERELGLALSVWREDEGEHLTQQILSSDLVTFDDRRVILGEVLLPLR